MARDGKRVAWVTGGGSGIGEAGAVALAADGWTVVVSGRRKDALDAVVKTITRAGGEAEAIPLDVSVAADVEMAAEQILARHGRIDLLVNTAAFYQSKKLEDVTADDLRRHFEVNVLATFLCGQQAGLAMAALMKTLALRTAVSSDAPLASSAAIADDSEQPVPWVFAVAIRCAGSAMTPLAWTR